MRKTKFRKVILWTPATFPTENVTENQEIQLTFSKILKQNYNNIFLTNFPFLSMVTEVMYLST